MTPAQKFRAALRKAGKAMQALREGSDDVLGVRKLLNRAEDLTRWLEWNDPAGEKAQAREEVLALSAQMTVAIDEGYRSRQAGRDREMATLREKIRESKPRPGTHEHDLAMMPVREDARRRAVIAQETEKEREILRGMGIKR